MSYRRLVFLALLGLPTLTWAQFTTFIPPQNKLADSVKTTAVAQQRVQADSLMKERLTNMKSWVDSAAGVVAMPMTKTDTSVRLTAVDSMAMADTLTDSTRRLRKGTRAPATASDLPLLALLGAISLAIGTVMLAGTQLGRDRA
jgi:hypothetical protein